MRIGLSLSFCVRDIIKREVRISGVACIVTNTCVHDLAELDVVIERYQSTYWHKEPKLARTATLLLWNSGRIIQPRLCNPHYQHSTNAGHWIELTTR